MYIFRKLRGTSSWLTHCLFGLGTRCYTTLAYGYGIWLHVSYHLAVFIPTEKKKALTNISVKNRTPIGQAIGLATHTLYSPDSEVGLIMVGTMNALSSGLLVYASLVELLAEDFLSDESWRILRGKRRVYACILVFLGAFGMSLVGAWA